VRPFGGRQAHEAELGLEALGRITRRDQVSGGARRQDDARASDIDRQRDAGRRHDRPGETFRVRLECIDRRDQPLDVHAGELVRSPAEGLDRPVGVLDAPGRGIHQHHQIRQARQHRIDGDITRVCGGATGEELAHGRAYPVWHAWTAGLHVRIPTDAGHLVNSPGIATSPAGGTKTPPASGSFSSAAAPRPARAEVR